MSTSRVRRSQIPRELAAGCTLMESGKPLAQRHRARVLSVDVLQLEELMAEHAHRRSRRRGLEELAGATALVGDHVDTVET